MEAPITQTADRHPAKLGNFAAPLLRRFPRALDGMIRVPAGIRVEAGKPSEDPKILA